MKTLLLALLVPVCTMAQNPFGRRTPPAEVNQETQPKVVENIQNPMLWADVPDPDVIRVGDTFYLVSTTMHLMPEHLSWPPRT